MLHCPSDEHYKARYVGEKRLWSRAGNIKEEGSYHGCESLNTGRRVAWAYWCRHMGL